jgi:hypothetical protein
MNTIKNFLKRNRRDLIIVAFTTYLFSLTRYSNGIPADYLIIIIMALSPVILIASIMLSVNIYRMFRRINPALWQLNTYGKFMSRLVNTLLASVLFIVVHVATLLDRTLSYTHLSIVLIEFALFAYVLLQLVLMNIISISMVQRDE